MGTMNWKSKLRSIENRLINNVYSLQSGFIARRDVVVDYSVAVGKDQWFLEYLLQGIRIGIRVIELA